MFSERAVEHGDGRRLHVYDSGESDGSASVGLRPVALVWHHGTPQTGLPPEPLLKAALALGVRWVSVDRPGYGSSTPLAGRDVAAVAGDIAAVVDALGLERLVVLGASGGGPHALACAALLPERVVATACIGSVAPFDAEGLSWTAGMTDAGAAEFHAADAGHRELEHHLAEHAADDPDLAMFVPADLEAFSGPYAAWLVTSTMSAMTAGLQGWVDDDLAFVHRWGFVPEQVRSPLLLIHGAQDRVVPSSHLTWLAEHHPHAQRRLEPDDGHISIFRHAGSALDWLVRQCQ